MIDLLSISLQSSSFPDAILKSWPIFAAVLVWIFLIMRPQSQARKKQSNFLSELEKGQEVVTDSGIIGRINKIDDDVITLQIEGKNYIRVMKSSLSEARTATIRKTSNES